MAFEPGVSGNPGGKPKTKVFRDALNLAINRADGDKTKLARIAEALVDKAADGDVPAIREIADRLDGKATQPIAGDDEAAPIRQRIERVIIDTADRDAASIQAASSTEEV
jgi:hypothetical protein